MMMELKSKNQIKYASSEGEVRGAWYLNLKYSKCISVGVGGKSTLLLCK